MATFGTPTLGPPLLPGRPGPVTLIAAVGIALGALGLLLAVIMLFAAEGSADNATIMLVMAVVYGLLGAMQLTAALGLWQVKPWGRTFQLALSWIGASTSRRSRT